MATPIPTEALALPLPLRLNIEFTPGGCWLWTGKRNAYGYGLVRLDGKIRLAHRRAYAELVEECPGHMDLDHTCHNRDLTCSGGKTCIHRRCVNPSHLDMITRAENTRRSPLTPAGQSHCLRCGGEFGTTGGSRPQRRCLPCAREYQREYRREYRRKVKRAKELQAVS